MKTIKPSTAYFPTYPHYFRVHVHQLIAWGYKDAKPKIKTDDEEIITSLMYEAIRSILLSGRERWFSKYDVHNETPIPGGERTGRDRREIDLVIKWVTKKGKPEYVFEAKPLNFLKKYQRTSNYVGREGMGRFMTGEYADYTANYPEVGMLGYILSDTPDQWRNRLKNAITKKQIELQLKSSQRDVTIIDDLSMQWVSEHKRNTIGRPIIIYHILLDCCS